MIKAVLFDVDGTLLDTTEYIFQAFEHSLMTTRGQRLDRSKINKSMGKVLVDCYKILTGTEDVADLVQAHRDFHKSNHHLAVSYSGAKETLQKIQKSGKKIGAVTSRSRDSALTTLTNNGLMEHIDILIALEDVTNPKPHPEGIQKALSHFGFLPHEAVMVGDSDVDIIAGKAAGTGTIGVSYGFHGENIGTHNPDKVIKSLLEILTELNI